MKTGAILVGLVILCACATKQANDIGKAQWLIGTWENRVEGQTGNSPKGSVYETWNKVSDAEFSGKSFLVNGKDTLVFEQIQLVLEQGKLLYIPTVINQNEGLPVRFAAKSISETQLVFENPEHDFPQIISYTKIGVDSLVAEISGTKNGQRRRQAFSMKRVK